jgi:hypothetical protein
VKESGAPGLPMITDLRFVHGSKTTLLSMKSILLSPTLDKVSQLSRAN